MMNIRTSYGTYEVTSLHEFDSEKEDVFSCQNDCESCRKTCEIGQLNRKLGVGK